MFLTLPSEPDCGRSFHAACLPQASGISSPCLCWGSPQPETLEQQQRLWPSPSGSHQQPALSWWSPTTAFPSHLSLPQGLAPEFHRMPQKNFNSVFFLYCTDVLIQAEHGGCSLLAELNYYLKISPAPTVPSLTGPQNFRSQRAESQ